MPYDPAAHYAERLDARRASVEAADRAIERLGTLRVVAAVFALVVFFAASFGHATAHLLWLPLAAFVWLVIRYGRASQQRHDAARAVRLYERGLGRLEDRWAGEGDTRALGPDHHVYADDLDLFGKGSLFDLVSRARTHAGARRLADWWLAPSDAAAVRERQAAARDLAGRLDLREDLALIGGEVSSALDRGSAGRWGAADAALPWPWFRWVALGLGLVSATCLVWWLGFGGSAWTFAIVLGVQLFVLRFRVGDVQQALDAGDAAAKDLTLAGRLLARIAEETFEAPRLVALQSAWSQGDASAAVRIQKLARLSAFAESRMNAFIAPFSMLFCVGTQLAYAMEDWRAAHGHEVAGWIDALGDFEALLSIATYAFERPDHTWPEILPEGAVVEADGVGHPLLPDERCVRNDVRLAVDEAGPRALLISGSNMSGKSTLMRSLGINIVLALSGAPVRATRLRLGPISVGASIRVTDSLQEGASRFYAEIARLKDVLDLTDGDMPTLFLLDEILHGTNSHDRRIGAAAVVKALLARGAIGCVTTHDLALATIVQDLPQVRNVHFADEVQGEEIVFDYRMRDGVVERSNALALMRAVGLPLDDPEPSP